MATESHTPADLVAAHLRPARRVLIFTGAGVSTESGIPDFRGPQGIWKRRRPVYYDDFMRSEAARVEYWDYKLEGWQSFRDARPNAVHQAIDRLERARKLESVVTQNVDGLHGKAGTFAAKLVEIHGTNSAVECQSCLKREDPELHFEHFRTTRKPPSCDCGGFFKPATISFGQQLRQQDLERAFAAAECADLVVSLGSTLSVQPAASVPLRAAERGVPYVIINRGETDHDGHPALALRLEGDVGLVFPEAVGLALKR